MRQIKPALAVRDVTNPPTCITVSGTELPEVLLVEPRAFCDARGTFYEAYSQRDFHAQGLRVAFVQDNVSTSHAHVIRGLHFQVDPPQVKLVRVLHGAIWDVVVDLRRGSPRFGRHIAVTLSAETRRALLIPAGFAHGFLALEPCCVLYKTSSFYAPAGERGVAHDDPDLAIPWPARAAPVLSDRDRMLPRLRDVFAHDFPSAGAP